MTTPRPRTRRRSAPAARRPPASPPRAGRRPRASRRARRPALPLPRTRERLRAAAADLCAVALRDDAPTMDYLAHAFFGPPAGAPADCVVWANRGGGKTFLGALATALELLFRPGIAVRILGGSLEQASRMHEHLRAFFRRPVAARAVDRLTERRVRLRNRSVAELLAQSETSVRGARVQRVRCDEVELFDPAVWEAVQLTTRSRRCAGVEVRAGIECLSTMHEAHGLMARLVDDCRAGRRALFRWGLPDVLEPCPPHRQCHAPPPDPVPDAATGAIPEAGSMRLPVLARRSSVCPLLDECAGRAKAPGHAGHLAIDDAIRMKARVSAPAWESEMLCRRPGRTHQVFPEFERDAHVVDDLPWGASAQGLAWFAGIDFGFRAPTVILWGALDEGGLLWIVDERVRSGAVLRDHVEALLAAPWPRPAWVGIDPAGAHVNEQTGISSAQVLRGAGLPARWRRAPVAAGLELIRARLRPASGVPPRLRIHRRCERLVESLERYHYDAARPHAPEPVKDGPDHAVDALRYLVTALDRPYSARLHLY